MELKDWELSDTFRELYAALHNPRGVGLVPSLTGRSVYDREAAPIYNAIFRCTSTLRHDDGATEQRLLARGLLHANLASRDCIASGRACIEQFRRCMQKRCDPLGGTPNGEYEKARKNVDTWTESYLDFYRSIDGSHQHVMQELFAGVCTSAEPALMGHPLWLWLTEREVALLQQFLALLISLLQRLVRLIDTLSASFSCTAWLEKKLSATDSKPSAADRLRIAKEKPFDTGDLIADIDRYLPIIDFEALTGIPMPIEALAKLAFSDPDHTNTQALETWMQQLSAFPASELMAHWRTAMEALHSHLRKYHAKEYLPFKTLCEIEWFLMGSKQERARFFQSDDKLHLQWRLDNIATRKKILCNDHTFILEKQVGAKIRGKDERLFFEISEVVATPADTSKLAEKVPDPDRLVCIANNRSILAIEQLRQRHQEGGFPSATILEVAADGRMALVEKLREPARLSAVNKQSKSPSNPDILAPVAGQIAHFLACGSMTLPLRSIDHMFDSAGFLKRTRVAEEIVPVDWLVLAEYARDVVNNDREAWGRLMRMSKLENHAAAFRWRHLLQCRCEGRDPGTMILRSVNSSEEKHGERLVEELDKMKAECTKALGTEDADMEKKINAKLWELYSAFPSAGALPPHLVEDVVIALKTTPPEPSL